MLDLMCNHFIWPQMAIQAKEPIDKCCQWITFKAKQQWAPMENIMATHLLELVHIDYLCLEPGKGKEENILVVTDHMSPNPRQPRQWPMPSGTTSLSTMGYWRKSFLTGGEILRELIALLCKLMGIKIVRTSLYHPQTNGQCERFNSTLINMLHTLRMHVRLEGWYWSANPCLQLYPKFHHGFQPYFIMYGRQSQLPIDITLRLTLKSVTMPISTKFIQKLRRCIRWAHRKADLFQQKEVQCHKYNYDKWSKAVS